jgi:hypothetical protein
MTSLPPTLVNGSDLTTWWQQRAQWLYVALAVQRVVDSPRPTGVTM